MSFRFLVIALVDIFYTYLHFPAINVVISMLPNNIAQKE